MSKSDLPPAYEDALHSPRHGNYPSPQPPAYGPYPAQSSAHYPGQAGYPQGYPPAGMPYSIPLGMPTSNPVEDDGFQSGHVWESTSIRHAFIRKVYLVLAAQLIVTVSVVAVFTFVDEVRVFVIRNPALYWTSFVVYFVTYCILVCCKGPRRRFPWNFVLLALFTLAMSYMTGTISSYYDTKAVFITIGITATVCIVVTIFCFQTKVDFTSCGGLFCVLAIVVMVTGIITAIVLSFKYVPWLHMLYAAIGAVVYTLFLAYNTQLLIGNRELSLSPEEYVFGALSLYVDIVQIFIFLLQLVGVSSD
uniref:Transmembrane BAX inhibitor motif containing 1b n=1 Tax=Esox lucius TaxID=8010 RepID=A0A3P8YEL7_ESOLU